MDLYKYPRLYIEENLRADSEIEIGRPHVHYLKNVLRRQEGDNFRVFNGRDGEWLAEITALSKKTGRAVLKKLIKPQPATSVDLHLIFAPLKKHRMDIVIEKAVELGVSEFHPVLTERTEVRKLNVSRLEAQIIEAAEQCERLTLPFLHPLTPLDSILHNAKLGGRKYSAPSREKSTSNREEKDAPPTPIYACIERGEALPLAKALQPGPAAFIIGPVGGLTEDECAWLRGMGHITAVSLGETILRAETAALACLSLHMLQNA